MPFDLRLPIVTILTVYRFVAAALIAIFLWPLAAWTTVFVVMLSAFLSDWLDGWLARRWRVVTAFGKIADPLADKAVCLVMLWLLFSYYQSWPYLVCAGVITAYDVAVTVLRWTSKKAANPVRAASWVAKLKTATLMTGLTLAVASIAFVPSETLSKLLAGAGLILLAVASGLCVWSFSYYLRQSLLKPGQRGFKGVRTVLEHHASILTIDFASWHRQGITCLLIDVDSTITPWLGTAAPPEVARALKQARRAGWVTHIGLVTNARKKSAPRIRKLAKQCGADAWFQPGQYRHRKPSPSLMHRAMAAFQVTPEHVAVIGDKYTSDVIAAKRAGVAKVAWVERLGDADHPYDRLVRRPVERVFRPSRQADRP